MQKKPTDYLQHIYYDCITYDPRALEYLVSIVGSSQIMFGTDWPHQVFDIEGAKNNIATLSDDDCDAIRHLNANQVFSL